jgi:uncharacterized protein YkwD
VSRIFLLTLLAGVAASAALAAPPPPDPGQVESALIRASNGFRSENGLKALAPDDRLNAEARRFAEYLARTNSFSHTADGREPSDRAEAAGYDYCELAENIAFVGDSSGMTLDTVVRRLMAGWEASPGHRRNLLNANVSQTGVGVALAPGGDEKYFAVQEFGRPSSARYSFRIENHSDEAVGYVLEGEHRRLPPHTTAVHSPCVPVDIAFDDATGAGQRRFAVAPGATYVLSPALKGVQIEVQQRPRSSGRVDED